MSMRMTYCAAVLLAGGLTGCITPQGMSDAPRLNGTRVTTATLTALRDAFGDASDVRLALPRFGGIHAGDVFVSPVITSSSIRLRLQNRLCNLGEQLGGNVPVESRFVGVKTPLNDVFSASGDLRADILSLFSFRINDPAKPVYAAQVKLYNPQAYTVSTTIRATMYPDDSACARAITQQVARGREVVVIDVVYLASPFVRVAFNASAAAELTKAVGPLSSLGANAAISDTRSFGDETDGNAILLAASYRPIRSAADIRR